MTNTARMPTRDELIDLLNSFSDSFHKIAMSFEADRMLASDSKRMKNMNPKLLEAIKARQLTSEQISRLCTDGFQTCVQLLLQLGAPDVAIHSCNPSPEQ